MATGVSLARGTGFSLSPERFIFLRDLIEKRCGLHFDVSHRGSLSASLKARMDILGISSVDEYCDRLSRDVPSAPDTESRHLINLVTVTETCFFRDAGQFRALREQLLPSILATPGRSPVVRIWSAGCATGEEAYSVAMTLWDMGVYLAYPGWTFEIVGTDLNTRALEAAERGEYSARAVRNVEPRLLRRWFRQDGARFHLRDEIRRLVRFEQLNLTQVPLRPPSAGLQDIIFCKNVAIYFRREVAQTVLRGAQEALAEGGHLLLGHSETLWHLLPEGLTLLDHDSVFYYRKTMPNAVTGSAVSTEERRVGRSARDLPRLASPRAVSSPVVRSVAPATTEAPAEDDGVGASFDACVELFRAGDWDAAEASLTALVRSCPTFVPAHLLLGGVYVHWGRYDDAFKQGEQVLRLAALEPRAHLLLGMIAASRGQPDEALRSLRRALYLDDSLALARFWLANLYRDRGDTARACLEYRNVVRDWERRAFALTEEFAVDVSADQIVNYCTESLSQLEVR